MMYLNIVIPMCGLGERFKKEKYIDIKPLIRVNGRHMFEWSVESFRFIDKSEYDVRFIFIILEEYEEKYQLKTIIKNKYPDSEVVMLKTQTRGQAETVLLGLKNIKSEEKLIVYNTDTYSVYSKKELDFKNEKIDGIIPCFQASEEIYSYASVDSDGNVDRVAEKKVISSNASNGFYYFRTVADFNEGANFIIDKGLTTNGEFYVAPIFNYLIKRGKKIIICDIKENWILGTPSELENFKENYKK